MNLILIFNLLIIPLENHKNLVYKNTSGFDEVSNQDITIIKASNGYDTNLSLIESINEVFWGENMTFSVNFTFTDDGGTTWKPITDPSAYCNLTIKSISLGKILIKETLIPQANGNFSITINSSRLSAGYSEEYYFVEVNGFHPIYNNPDPLPLLIKVRALPTGYAIYDYESRQQITDGWYTQCFNELLNITIRYYDSANQNDLFGATMNYIWDSSESQFYADPVYDGYYTFTLNTSDAPYIGINYIIIIASLENYTTQAFAIYLRVRERPTTLNNKTGILYIPMSIWAGMSYNFSFEYRDYLTKEKLSNLDVSIYNWQKLDATGNIIPGESGVGTLVEDIHKNYTLDFDTKNRNVGYYMLYITLQKENYEMRFAIINLIIKRRPTSINGAGLNISISKNLIFLNSYNFTFEFNDTLLNERIGDLDQAYYNWYKIDEDGNPISLLSVNFDLITTVDNYYILDFNTSDRSVGTYLIFVYFQKDNYEPRNVTIFLEIERRPTSINGADSNISISKNLIFLNSYNFTFEFNDTLLNERIGNLDQAYYNWYKIDDNGNPISLLSVNFDLIKTVDNYYILDFNSSHRSIGTYLIFVYFQKDNYEPRNVTIILTISYSKSLYNDENRDENDNKKEGENEDFDILTIIITIGIVSIAFLIGIYSLKKGILQMGIKSIRNKMLETKK